MYSFAKTLVVPLILFHAICLSSGSVLLDSNSSHQMSFDVIPLLDLSDDLVMGDSGILSAIKKNIDGDAGTISLHRRLAGDFDEFNDLFRDAVIELPPTTITEKILFDLTMNLNEIKCTNMNVTDIVITYNKEESNHRLWFQVDVVDLAMNCFIEYDYKYGLLSGKGNAKAYSDNNAASVLLSFDSANFDEVPPTSSTVHNCTADISLNDLDFGGDWISSLLDTFERLIRIKVEDEVKVVACEELSSLGGTLVNEVLQLAADTLEPYLTVLSASDPLASEKALQVPEDMLLLNFQDTENVIGSWFDAALQEADALLGTVVDDDDSPTGTGSDLGINVFLRDYVLDDDLAFAVDVADLPLDNGGVLFQAHDKLTETTITLDSVQIFGLDTFTRFEALIDIGQYTLQNELTWNYLTMELDVTIDMKPSTKPDAIIQGASDENIVEKVKISFGVDELDAVVSVLLAIDQEELGSLKLGPMLNTSNLLPCLLSTVFDMEISEISVSAANIREPTLDGFVSAGIDRIVSQSVKAVFLMYEKVLLDAVPNIFATTFRNLVNKELLDKYMSDPVNSQCSPVKEVDGFIDFRDLLLKPDLAAIAGGSGEEPYGNLAYTLMTLVKDQLLATEDDGLPSINSVLIGQLTEAQSGVKGMVQFPSELFSLAEDNAMGLHLAVSNLRLHNLDTLRELSILQPSNDPHVLSNLINIGPVIGRPLNGTLRLLVGLDNPDPSVSMINEMDISASVASSILSADFLAQINATELMQFPLRDILNMNCWLAKFPAPELDANGVRVDPSDNSSMALVQFFMSLTAFSMNVACIDCRSPGVAVLPDVLKLLEGLGSISLLQTRLEYLAQDIIMSDWIQSYADQMLSKAPKSCPHTVEYDENVTESKLSGHGFPSLSREGVETLIFGAAVAAHVGTVVIAESHSSYNATATDILSQQNNLQVPEDVRLLDLTALGSTIGSWVDSAIEEVNGFLTHMTDDVGGPNGDTDLGINVFLRDQLLNNRRAFSFTFDDVSIERDKMEIAFKEIRIIGLDTFTTVNVLNMIAAQTIENEFAWQNLSVEIDVFIKTVPPSSSTRLLQNGEVLTVSFGVKDVNVAVGLFLALDQDRLGSLALGSVMKMDGILLCLLSSAYEVEVTELSVIVGETDSLSFTGFFSDQVDSNMKNLTQTTFDKYGASMIAAVPGIFDVTVRGLINNWIQYYLDLDSSTSCPQLDFEPSQTGFIQFQDLFLSSEKSVALGGTGESQYGDMFQRLYSLVNEQILQIDETDDTSSINHLLITPLTRGASGSDGTIRFEGDLFNMGNRVQVGGLDAKVELKAYDARIENLDSVGKPLILLDPVLNESHLLNNTATFGVGPSPLRLGIKFMFALLADDAQIQNDVDITLDLTSATIAAVALLKIAEDRFTSFPLRDVLNIDCWLATLPAPPLDARGLRLEGAQPSASLQNIASFIASVDLNVTCINCTSPKMEELAVLLSSKEGGEDAAKAVNTILDLATKLLGGEFLSITIDRLLNEAPKKCPHRAEYQRQPVEAEYEPFGEVDTGNGSTEFLITLIMVIACMIGALALVSLAIRWVVRRRHGIWLRSLSAHSINLICTRQNAQKTKETEINRITTSMFTSTDIPRYMRWLIPLVILGNIGFFLSGHLSLGATVNIEADIGGQTFSEDKFYEFSMAKSTIDIWNAGGEELAILIAIFSGVWPYTKQLITLALWFCPPRFVSTSRRGSTLLWMDILGKWSMVDIFVLVVSIASFWVAIESPDVAFLPEGFYSVNLLVVPLWGLYANMIAQLISQVSSHIIIHYHRKMVDSALARCNRMLQSDTCRTEESAVSEQSGSSQTEADEPTILRKHTFERPHRGEFDKLQVSRGVNGGLCFVAVAVTVLVIIGCIFPSAAREVLGIVGVAVESGQDFEEAVTYYSVFTLVQLLMKEARFLGTAGDYIGLGTLSALFIVTILVVPILQVLTLLRQWFMPLSQKQRTRMSVLTEIFQAWQYVEVYVLAIVVSVWQLGPLSNFMINSYCDGLSDTFATLVYYGVLDPADAQCFKVQAAIESATYLLIAAAVLLGILHTFVVKAVTQYERDASQLHAPLDDAKLGENESGMSHEEYNEAVLKIDPVPVLFTDRFRWVMRREDACISSRARRGLDERSKLGVDDGFPSDEPSALERSFSEEAGPAGNTQSKGRSLEAIPESAQELNEGLPAIIDERSEYGTSVYEDEDVSVYQYEEDDL